MPTLNQLEKRIEAILFANGDAIERKRFSEILQIDEPAVHKLVTKLRDRYSESAIDIKIMDGSYQMCSRPEYADDIRQALEIGRNSALSNAALEVLAIIAYNQPVTRAFVEEIRGVDCSYHIKNLSEKSLIEEAGRLNIPGKPIVYSTTNTFLRSFGLESIENLPTIPEVPDVDPDSEDQIEGQIDLFEEKD